MNPLSPGIFGLAAITLVGMSWGCEKPRLNPAMFPQVGTGAEPDAPNGSSVVRPNQVPDGVDAALWRVLAEGLPDPIAVDFQRLTASSQLDADVAIELRPSLVANVGLWQPFVARLPLEMRTVWQAVIDAMGVDPVPRTDAASFSARLTKASRAGTSGEAYDKVTVFLRTRDGMAADILRWTSKYEAEHRGEGVEKLGEVSVAIFERLSADERKAAQTRVVPANARVAVHEVSSEVTLLYLSDEDQAALITPHGVVAVRAGFDTLGEAVETVSRVLRRAQAGQGDSSEDGAVLLRARMHSAKAKMDINALVRLDKALDINVEVQGVLEANKGRNPLDRDRAELEKAFAPIVAVAPRTGHALIRTARSATRGDVVTFEASVPLGDLVADAGGVSLPQDEPNAASIGRGLDIGAIRSAPATQVAVRSRDEVSRAATPSIRFAFEPATTQRSEVVRRWLEVDGSLRNFAENVARTFGASVPVRVAECGEINAFYHPATGQITLCYELVASLAEMLRPSFNHEQLGSAVLGTTLWILIHEYGHALIHQQRLPVTGREEDAVDQLATLKLIESGEDGIKYALAAQQWFSAAVRLGHEVPNWDEHSPNGVRFYEISCLIYGSNPDRFSSLAGSAWLPSERARRCPSEFRKVNAAWTQILTQAGSAPDAARLPSRSPSSTTPSAPAEPTPTPQSLGSCTSHRGTWEITTTVTSALRSNAIGVRGFYRMSVMADCGAVIEKLGFEKTMFTPDRVQRGVGTLREAGPFWELDTAFMRDGKVDYTATLRFDFRAGLVGGWRYTGSSWDTTRFEGTLSGRRL